jgi:hypothetical protein
MSEENEGDVANIGFTIGEKDVGVIDTGGGEARAADTLRFAPQRVARFSS